MSKIISACSGEVDTFYGKSAEPVKEVIEQRAEAWEDMSVIKKVFKMETTENWAEKYTYMTTIGNLKKVGENDPAPRDTFKEGFNKVIEPDEFKNSVAITRKMLEDGKFEQIKNHQSALVNSAYRSREIFGAMIFDYANKNTGVYDGEEFDVRCADGKPILSASHPSVTRGNKFLQSNYFNAALTFDNFATVMSKMQDFRDDDKNLLSVMPDTLIIPNDANMIKQATAIVGSMTQPNADGHQYEASPYTGIVTIVVWKYLNGMTPVTGTATGKAWYLLDSEYNNTYGGLIFLDRIAPSVRMYVDDNTYEQVTEIRARFMASGNDWRAIAGCLPGDTTATSVA
jgi:phage major head subunit gpT-like protein